MLPVVIPISSTLCLAGLSVVTQTLRAWPGAWVSRPPKPFLNRTGCSNTPSSTGGYLSVIPKVPPTAGLLWSIVWLAAIGASAVAAQSDRYGVVFGTGYNATTQYFNKNSSVTYTDGSCTDFFTIVLGLAAQNSTGPTGSIYYQDLESGVVLAKSELTPQGSIFTGGPSYSIANVTKLKTWRLPHTYSKVMLC